MWLHALNYILVQYCVQSFIQIRRRRQHTLHLSYGRRNFANSGLSMAALWYQPVIPYLNLLCGENQIFQSLDFLRLG